MSLALAVGVFEVGRWFRRTRQPLVHHTSTTRPTHPSSGGLVSFLVPAWNAASDVEPFIRSFNELELSAAELILCAGGGDETFEQALRFAGEHVRVVRQEATDGKQGALQKCWQAARGDVIYLTDVDCRLETEVVRRVLAPVQSGQSHAATGGFQPLPEDWRQPLVRCRAAVDLLTGPPAMVPSLGLDGRNAAVTRVALEEVGGFRTPARSGTDYTLAQELRRRGFSIVYVPDARMPTRYPHRFGAYARQQRRWLRNIFVLGRRYRVNQDVRNATVTFLLTYGGIAAVILGLAFGWYVLPEAVALGWVHVWLTRLAYQKRLGLKPEFWATMLVMLADMASVVAAGVDILVGMQPW
jgi:cellulose synthase/poly-beta-1,6-N-acetylglucosamine synthase-like glycosyltransferase